MNIRYTPIFILLLFCLTANAQNGTAPIGNARSAAMGDASVTFTGISAAFGNQAGLAFMDGIGFSLGAERRFFTSEINSLTAAFAYPAGNAGTFGLATHYYGFSGYNEQRIGLAYSRKLMDKLAIGAQFDYLGFSIPEYGRKGIITFELGLMAKLTEDFSISTHIFNPVSQEIVEGEKVPTVFRLGAAYHPNPKLFISGELEKDMDFDMVFKGGVEYYLVKKLLCLRAGVSTNPVLNSFGLGLRLDNGLMVDVASSYHYSLGFTPSISISFEMGKKDAKDKDDSPSD